MRSFASRIHAVVLALTLFAITDTVAGQEPRRWPGALPTQVTVTITDTELDMPTALPPGLLLFRVTNAGNEPHGFEIAGRDIKTGFALNLDPGETRDLRTYLDPGSYSVYCPIEGHAHRTVQLDVRDAERIR